MFVAKAIERVGDHAKNLAEEIIYIVKGTDVRHNPVGDGRDAGALTAQARGQTMSRILVVEDESAIAELIAINLRHAGFEVTIAGDADAGAGARSTRVLPDLVLLDWMLPGPVRPGSWPGAGARDARTRELPIIMLTARADEPDKVVGPRRRCRRLPDQAVLDAGADGAHPRACCAARRRRRWTRRSRSAALRLDPATRRVIARRRAR